MTAVLVVGSTGQLARSLAERAARAGIALDFAGREQIDLTDADSFRRTIGARAPTLIVNAAAYTDVDRAEAEPENAHRINAVSPGLLATAAREAGAGLIHISTDYVFDGRFGPYDEDAATSPLGVYGRTKLEGEMAVRAALPDHAIVRTAWVYSPFGRNFVKTMLTLARDRPELRVVDDQIGTPTSALDLADGLLRMVHAWDSADWPAFGRTFHLAGRGETSWAGLAREVFARSASAGGPSAQVEPIPGREWPTVAERPADSRLDSTRFERAFGYAAPPWAESVDEIVRRLLESPATEESRP